MSSVKPTAQNLRGLAHPLRVRLLGLLREHGPATATRLAELNRPVHRRHQLPPPPLAAYGFVEEDSRAGTGRERWWRASHGRTVLEAEQARQAPADAEAYLRSVALLYADRVQRWLGEAPLLPPEWDNAATLSDVALRLTPQEAVELLGELRRLMDSYRGDRPDTVGPEGAERVVLQVQLLPFVRRDEQ